MRKILLFIIFLSSLNLFAIKIIPQVNDPMNAIVKINVVSCSPNFGYPWMMTPQMQSTGSGVVISGNYILTNAHNVSNSTYLSVSKENDGTPVMAKIKAIDHQCDLALLEVQDKKFFNNITPFDIGETPPVKTQVLVAGYPLGGNGISLTQGIISRIEAVLYAHSGTDAFLAAQLDAAINPGNSGGPIIYQNKVVGIAFQGNRAGEGLGYMIHTEIINHFLEDIEDGNVDGFGSLGISEMTLENPDTRKYLKMKDGQSGVLITKVYDFAGKDSPMKEGDVIMKIENMTIMNNGYIRTEKNENRLFHSLADSKQMGESLSLDILRDGKEMKISVLAKKPYMKVNPRMYAELPRFYIAGPLVFTSLSISYLDGWKIMPRKFAMLYDEEKDKLSDDVVILTMVLGDESSMGYQYLSNMILESVNGIKIENLKHLSEVFNSIDDEFAIFKFDFNVSIILDVKKMKSSLPRIMEVYKIPLSNRL